MTIKKRQLNRRTQFEFTGQVAILVNVSVNAPDDRRVRRRAQSSILHPSE